jgi:hypothetical protein
MKWISCKERLPENDSLVLVFLEKDPNADTTTIFEGIFYKALKKLPIQEGCKRKELKEIKFFSVWCPPPLGEMIIDITEDFGPVLYWIYVDDIPKPD